MSNSLANNLEPIFDRFDRERTKLEKANVSLRYHQQQYNEIGQAYLAAGPYQADHEAFEFARARWQEAATEREMQVVQWHETVEALLHEILSCRPQDLSADKSLLAIHKYAASLRRRRRLRQVFAVLTVASLLAGIALVGAGHYRILSSPSVKPIFLFSVALASAVLFLLSNKLVNDVRIDTLTKLVSDHVGSRRSESKTA